MRSLRVLCCSPQFTVVRGGLTTQPAPHTAAYSHLQTTTRPAWPGRDHHTPMTSLTSMTSLNDMASICGARPMSVACAPMFMYDRAPRLLSANITHTPLLCKVHRKELTPFCGYRPGQNGIGVETLQALNANIHQSTSEGVRHPRLHGICASQTRGLSITAKSIVEAAPTGIQPYLYLCRLDRPIGTWLIYLPSAWSIGLAATPGHLPDLPMLALFGAGALLMRGAGCTINDMWDKDIDKEVARTRMRPLASGRLTNFQALTFLGLQLSASLTILLSLNWYSVILGVSVLGLVVTYPLMKRVTFWPQVFLGLTINWGALLGYSAIQGSCDWAVCLPLYVAGIMWTMLYDTIYAYQDREDDLKIGVGSTALYMGDAAKPWFVVFAGTMVSALTLTGLMAHQAWPFYLGVAGVAAHLTHQIYTVNLNNVDDCAKKFRSNRYLGMFIFAAIVAGNLLRTSKDDQPETPDQATI